MSEMVERVSTRFDRIDVLVNNAGIEPYFALNEMDRAERSPRRTYATRSCKAVSAEPTSAPSMCCRS